MMFCTEDLPFAAYLLATRKLTFIGCEILNSNGRLIFTFADPSRQAESLHIAFESGAECPAVVFYDSIRHLRRVMTRVQNNGASKNDHRY